MSKVMNDFDETVARELNQTEVSAESLMALGQATLAEIEPFLVLRGDWPQDALHRAHCTAIKNWLGKYQSSEDTLGRERVRGFREAYYHLREIGALRQAISVMKLSLRVQKRLTHQRWTEFEKSLVAERAVDFRSDPCSVQKRTSITCRVFEEAQYHDNCKD